MEGSVLKAADFMIKVQPIIVSDIRNGNLNADDYYNVDNIPVIDIQERYIGSISKDILASKVQRQGLNSQDGIESLLKHDIPCIPKEADIEELEGTEQAVVVDENRVIGIVTKDALIRALSKKMNEYKEQFETVINASENGILAINNSGDIIVANEVVGKLLCVNKKDIIGQKIAAIIPHTLLPEIVLTEKPLLGQKIEIGKTTVIANYSPIISGGKTVGAVSVFQDISIVEKAAYELDEVQSIMLELESIFNSSFDGLTVVDGNGIMLRVNNAYERLTGIQASKIIGKNMRDLIKDGYYDQSVSLKVIEQRQRVTINQTIKGDRIILVTGTPVFDEAGNLVRVVNNNRDVTELNNLQKEITKSKELNMQYRTELSHLRSMNMKAEDIIFRSRSMEQALDTAQKVARVDSTVLIIGESGTGKEIIAKIIHRSGKGADKPYIKINCAALPEPLLESELFGYDKGSFTGAKKEGKPGLFELAHGGTLLLDEIGDMPLFLQAKILRALQEKEIMRVGGINPISVDVRIIAATHRNLAKMVDNGSFRGDLFYRLMVVPIYLTPLRERKEDIPILIWHFIEKYNKKFNYNKSISGQAVDILTDYDWKGNVRELENVIERIVVTSNESLIEVEHLPEYIRSHRKFISDKDAKLKTALEQTELYLLSEAYKKLRSWDKVAEQLGITRPTAYRKAAKHGLIKN